VRPFKIIGILISVLFAPVALGQEIEFSLIQTEKPATIAIQTAQFGGIVKSATAVARPSMRMNGRLIVRLDVTDMRPGEYSYIVIMREDLSVEFIEDIFQLITLTPGTPRDPPEDSDDPAPDDSVMDQVREAFVATDELFVFFDQLDLLQEQVIIPDSITNFSTAYNHINQVFVFALKKYASKHWDAWLIPLIDKIEAEKAGGASVEKLRSIVKAAHAQLGN